MTIIEWLTFDREMPSVGAIEANDLVNTRCADRSDGALGHGGVPERRRRAGRKQQRIATAALRCRIDAGARGGGAAGEGGVGDVAEAETGAAAPAGGGGARRPAPGCAGGDAG